MPSSHILFFHGLESGINGRKSQYLTKQAKKSKNKVCIPDLDMSTWKLTKSNSFTRSLLRVLGSNPLYLFQPSILINETLKHSLTCCKQVGLELFNSVYNNEDDIILVGSSWGGAVVCWLLACQDNQQQLEEELPWLKKIKRIVLVAPAFQKAVTMGLGEIEAKTLLDNLLLRLKTRTIENNIQVIIIHGTNDDEVNIKDSKYLFEQAFQNENNDNNNNQLVIVPNGDHRLNYFLANRNNLWFAIEGKEIQVQQHQQQDEQLQEQQQLSQL
jgi:hypothetical protein